MSKRYGPGNGREFRDVRYSYLSTRHQVPWWKLDRITWTAVMILLAIILVLWLAIPMAESVDHVVSDAIKDKMRHHGVQASYEDWNGKMYFIRNGKRCSL
jgi:hypothetical protein